MNQFICKTKKMIVNAKSTMGSVDLLCRVYSVDALFPTAELLFSSL